MKLSLYTFVKDGLYYDTHIEAMLRHHVPYFDEIIVNEGYSQDGTYERIRAIDGKIRIVRTKWDKTDPRNWSIKFKNRARVECTGEWCVLLDCDEFIPEWECRILRSRLASVTYDIYPMRYLNFYGNYRVFHANPGKHNWPRVKWTVHRNLPHLEVWGDGSNVRSKCGGDVAPESAAICRCHHFGMVRHAARLRHKWRIQSKRNDSVRPRWDWIPGVVFDCFPHNWLDPDFLCDLAIYNDTVIEAVRSDPDEFIRDGMLLYNELRTLTSVSTVDIG